MLLCFIESSMVVVRVTMLRLFVYSLGGHCYEVAMEFPSSIPMIAAMLSEYVI